MLNECLQEIVLKKKKELEMKVTERFTEKTVSIVINFNFFFEELIDKLFNNKILIKQLNVSDFFH